MKRISYKIKKEKGLGLLAITMVFSVGVSLLATAALLTAVNTSGSTNYISQAAQAEQLANVGISRVGWMLVQKCLHDNEVKNINYMSYGLKGNDNTGCNLESSAGGVSAFTYPMTMPVGRYKVKIVKCQGVEKDGSGVPHRRKITIEALGQVGGVTRRVMQNIEIFERPTNLFSKAIIGNNIPGCMFCHLTIYGDVACMGSSDGVISHAGSGSSSKIYGTFYTNGNLLKSTLWNSYKSDSAIMAGDDNSTQTTYKVVRNYNNNLSDQTKRLPTKMDTMSSNKTYILQQCTTENPGSIKVDYASQIMPGKVYASYSTEADRINAIKTAAATADAQYGISKSNYVNSSGQTKSCYCIGYNSSTSYKGKYDLDNMANALNTDISYDSSVTLVGTEEHPIVIDGKIYIDGDVLIKGVVSGKGVIYSSRNVYVLGDLKYKTQPSDWTNPAASTNADQLGIVASGSVLLGDPFSPTAKTSDPQAMGRDDNRLSYPGISNYNQDVTTDEYGTVKSQRYAWQGYIRSLMVDGLFDGNEQGDSNNQFGNQYSSTSFVGGSHDEYFFHHNRYAWDGRDPNTTRVTRLEKAFSEIGVSPDQTKVDTGAIPKNASGQAIIPAKTVTTSPGLLPRGATVADNTDVNTPSRKYSEKYSDGWIQFSDWKNFVTKDKLKDDNNADVTDGDVPVPTATEWVNNRYRDNRGRWHDNWEQVSRKIFGSPSQIDSILYAEGCIAGGNFNSGVSPVFHGSFVSNDTHYINANYSGTNTTIYHDKRASDSFMGFPSDIDAMITGYEVHGSSTAEFETY